jgi:hypothetical protein
MSPIQANIPAYETSDERFTWKDTGCKHAPACLSCPFPACKYDEAPKDEACKSQGEHHEPA